jgi:hypothetical protein
MVGFQESTKSGRTAKHRWSTSAATATKGLDKRARSLQVEERRVEEESDEVLDHGLNLSHRRRRCDLFVHIVV